MLAGRKNSVAETGMELVHWVVVDLGRCQTSCKVAGAHSHLPA